ncbi:Protein bowellike, partial [Caligus rogercresseyi]
FRRNCDLRRHKLTHSLCDVLPLKSELNTSNASTGSSIASSSSTDEEDARDVDVTSNNSQQGSKSTLTPPESFSEYLIKDKVGAIRAATVSAAAPSHRNNGFSIDEIMRR